MLPLTHQNLGSPFQKVHQKAHVDEHYIGRQTFHGIKGGATRFCFARYMQIVGTTAKLSESGASRGFLVDNEKRQGARTLHSGLLLCQ